MTDEAIGQLTQAFTNITVVDETFPREGGFVLTEGRIDYNYLYSELVDDIRKEINLSVAKEVFGEE